MWNRKLIVLNPRCCVRWQSATASCSKESSEAVDRSNLVASTNPATKQNSVIQLRHSKTKIRARDGYFPLPKEAVEGLKKALVTTARPVKQLQYEADQLTQKLEQRKFPASPEEIKEARQEIRKSLNMDALTNDERFTPEINKSHEDSIKRLVEKRLRHTRYNWAPMSVESRERAATYFLSRLQANYAEVSSVLQEFKRTNFIPRRILDYGSGSCSVFWASNELWGNKVEEYQFVDASDEMNKFAMDVLRGSDNNDKHAFVHPNLNFRRFLPPSVNQTYDLIVAHRVMIELASEESRLELVSSLWKRTTKYLVLIESGLKGAYDALMSLRDFVLESGYEIHAKEARNLLSSKNILNEKIEAVIDDQQLTNFERFALLQELVPKGIILPTRLEPGFTFAPCPHDQGCPKLGLEHGVCNFCTKWPDLRADGKKPKRDDGLARGKFSYIIMEKGRRRSEETLPRILKSDDSGKQISFLTCTPFCGLQSFVLSKKNLAFYKHLRGRKAGEQLPVEMTTVRSESNFDLFNEALADVQKPEAEQ